MKKEEMSGIKADQHGNIADAYISEKWRNIYMYIYIRIGWRTKGRRKKQQQQQIYIYKHAYIRVTTDNEGNYVITE